MGITTPSWHNGLGPQPGAPSRRWLYEAVSLSHDGRPTGIAAWFKPHDYAERLDFRKPAEPSSWAGEIPDELLWRLLEYANLPDDWDGYGAQAVPVSVILDAFAFLRSLPTSLPSPKPMIGGGGLVGLYWEGNNCYVSVEFTGDGTYTYLADLGDSVNVAGNSGLDASLPPDLLGVIAATVKPTHARLPVTDPAANSAFATLLSQMPDVGLDEDFERLPATTAPGNVFD